MESPQSLQAEGLGLGVVAYQAEEAGTALQLLQGAEEGIDLTDHQAAEAAETGHERSFPV